MFLGVQLYKQYSSIVSDNGMAPIRRQSIIWNNDGLIYWRLYASLGLHVNEMVTVHGTTAFIFDWRVDILGKGFQIDRKVFEIIQWRHMSVIASQITGHSIACLCMLTHAQQKSTPRITDPLCGESTADRTNDQWCWKRCHAMTSSWIPVSMVLIDSSSGFKQLFNYAILCCVQEPHLFNFGNNCLLSGSRHQLKIHLSC